jgi:hypothetical protein
MSDNRREVADSSPVHPANQTHSNQSLCNASTTAVPSGYSRLATLPLFGDTSAGATFSHDRIYRYSLWRTWDLQKGRVLWIMLNPSTADEVELDPTVRRCIGFAKAWGYGGIEVCNIFALRSTDPKVLYSHPDPVGPDNDDAITNSADAARVVAAWGVHGALRGRGAELAKMFDGVVNLECLGVTKDRHPKHPLYVSGATELRPYKGGGRR